MRSGNAPLCCAPLRKQFVYATISPRYIYCALLMALRLVRCAQAAAAAVKHAMPSHAYAECCLQRRHCVLSPVSYTKIYAHVGRCRRRRRQPQQQLRTTHRPRTPAVRPAQRKCRRYAPMLPANEKPAVPENNTRTHMARAPLLQPYTPRRLIQPTRQTPFRRQR